MKNEEDIARLEKDMAFLLSRQGKFANNASKMDEPTLTTAERRKNCVIS